MFFLLLGIGLSSIDAAVGAGSEGSDGNDGIQAFGEGGSIKMLYDRRQRPQAVYLNGRVHIVFKGGAKAGTLARSAKTIPMAITYDPATRKFSDVVTLGPPNRDHHYAPVIWADEDDFLHVLYGCHKKSGTHLISKRAARIGSGLDAWREAPRIAKGISYPTAFRISGDRELVYYRTDGHSSSWTYRITEDNGESWKGPAEDVTDMDIAGRLEWSSYQSKQVSEDGRFLHVVFTSYDDAVSNDPKRLYNPRYDQPVSNGWKYNLYYVQIDLDTHAVTNFNGDLMETPIDIDQADARCRIWDTQWRGAGVPPTMTLDQNGDPAFLHLLSEDSLSEHRYYYVRRVAGQWKQTPITNSNHQWNSCHLARVDDGTLHAYLVVGEGYLDTHRFTDKHGDGSREENGYMDKHGGGSIEEWTSSDNGNSWKKKRDLTSDMSRYPGWKFNNIQPVTRPDGRIVKGMLLFYGWKDSNTPEARAFLLHEGTMLDPVESISTNN
jgi:hypothetical protein